MDECIFCAIQAGQAPASKVYEDEYCLAFMDLQPVTPGHLLIIPKVHAAYLKDLDPESGVQLFKAAQHLAAALRASGLRCEGVNLFLADGEAAGQEVFHVHLHVIARYDGDGFGFVFPEGYRKILPARAELDQIASAIRAKL